MSDRPLLRLAWLPLAVLIIFLAARATPSLAQSPGLAIDQASLRLWPEYDDPGLLVIFSGTFTGTTAFPQQVAFPLPDGARGIQATTITANGDLLSQPWQIVDGKLTYTLPGPAFQIEFYLDRPASGNQRDINYALETAYAITNLEITLQQPARATGFSATPQPERSVQGSDGFTYYAINRANVAAGAKLPINMRYTKSDQGVSVAQAQLNPTTPIPAPGTASSGAPASGQTQWLPILLIGLGVGGMAAAIGFWFLRARPADKLAPAAVRKRPASQQKANASGKAVFCTQCGRQLTAADRFCANCGAPRKG